VTGKGENVEQRAVRMRRYYEARAPEYDSTSYELAGRDFSSADDLDALERFVGDLAAGPVLDVGCGTAWLTRLLRGPVVGLDASESMLRMARERVPGATFVLATVPPLPFSDGSFDRVFSSHVYCHLETVAERRAFVDEALRVAPELVVVEQAWHDGLPLETWEERSLRDGSVHRVFKRYFKAAELADELGGKIALDTPSFVAARARRA
jgi:ubiquinone/menaquinone biosynthesis C-methylase UbiE